jgi:hypothetical protein
MVTRYSGELSRNPQCKCSMRIDHESGTMSGIIVSKHGNNSFGIEPSHKFPTGSQDFPMVIYKWSDIDHSEVGPWLEVIWQRKCAGIMPEEPVSLVSEVQAREKRWGEAA